MTARASHYFVNIKAMTELQLLVF